MRIFSAYSNLLYKQLPFSLAKKLWDDQDPTLFGDGTELRDFIHASDIAAIISQSSYLLDKSHFSIFNLGTGIPTSISEVGDIALITYLRYFPESTKRIKFNGILREGDSRSMWSDMSKLKSRLEFEFIPSAVGFASYFSNQFENMKKASEIKLNI